MKIGENIKKFDLYVNEPSRIKKKNEKFLNHNKLKQLLKAENSYFAQPKNSFQTNDLLK